MLVWSVNHAIQKTSSQVSQVKDVPLGRSAPQSRRWEMLGLSHVWFSSCTGRGCLCRAPTDPARRPRSTWQRHKTANHAHLKQKKPAVRSHIAFTVSLLSQSHIFFFLAKKTPESHPSSLCHDRQNTLRSKNSGFPEDWAGPHLSCLSQVRQRLSASDVSEKVSESKEALPCSAPWRACTSKRGARQGRWSLLPSPLRGRIQWACDKCAHSALIGTTSPASDTSSTFPSSKGGSSTTASRLLPSSGTPTTAATSIRPYFLDRTCQRNRAKLQTKSWCRSACPARYLCHKKAKSQVQLSNIATCMVLACFGQVNSRVLNSGSEMDMQEQGTKVR